MISYNKAFNMFAVMQNPHFGSLVIKKYGLTLIIPQENITKQGIIKQPIKELLNNPIKNKSILETKYGIAIQEDKKYATTV